MTPEPHPSDIDLAAFATGTLDKAEREMISAHISRCARCQAFVSAMEYAGGLILDSLPPTPLADRSLTELIARIASPTTPADINARSRSDTPSSSTLIRHRWFGGWDGARHRNFRTILARAALVILCLGITGLVAEYALFSYVDDYPASAATAGRVAIGGSATGTLERSGDADWFKVSLASGKTYRFHLEGSNTGRGTLQYPVLRLLDDAGQELHRDAGSIVGPGPAGPQL